MDIKKLEEAKSILEEQEAVKKTLENLETLQVVNKRDNLVVGSTFGGTVVYIDKLLGDKFLKELNAFYSAKKEELSKKFEEL